ncbi:GmrSD restriction endonuclease domain-containing protein [Arthrobacter cryoconiti]|uniref:DUF1524 domain-containing protein n=1 Tax=Arthrobacter cryoconiti TaxID=748907 RepID=A0ABV8QWK5_9MICC|nr:DUF1524 domain-containing protein [Arthrobacter cryoconiti]MCC9067308.1 DUF1524 domain-containing protein [Arthrobacter cryoconiti]
MPKSHPSKTRTTAAKHSFRSTDVMMGAVLASVLIVSTACGSTSAPTVRPASPVSTSASASALPSGTPSPTNSAPSTTAPAGANGTLAGNIESSAKALSLLATLPLKGRAPKTGYSRAEFGQAWADVDKNGCDTRNDILNRDLTAKTFKAGTRDCLVLTGILADPYTGKTIDFVRGAATSSKVQIDHVVALSDAWQKGAQQLSSAQRTALANDPLNLLAVDGAANQQKSDGDAATWLPANKSYRCEYVSLQISVKAAYNMWVTQAEHDAMARVLTLCSGAQTSTTPPPPAPAPAPAPAPQPAPAPVPAPAVAPIAPAPPAIGPQPFYKNCSAVRAAGKAPIHKGDPGFLSKFDGDGDGIGCE